MEIVEVGDSGGVARLQREWTELHARCPSATPYQSWEWNACWWRHLGARKRLRLLLFYDGASTGRQLVGLAPLYCSRHLGTPVRRLAWLGTGVSDYLDVLAAPEWAAAVGAALMDRLDSGMRGWDIADLQQLPSGSPLVQDEPWRHRPSKFQQLLPMEICPFAVLPASWPEFTASRGKRLRSNLGYYERLLSRQFRDVKFYLAGAGALDAGMTALFDLHRRRWNARWLPGVLATKRVQAFHREVAARFVERDWLRLHLCELDGQIRSALYCFAHAGKTYYYLGGFAPELGKYSLGTLLTGRAIRAAIEEGHVEFDFLRGAEGYKYQWAEHMRANQRLIVVRSRAGMGALPGRAGFALNRAERYVVRRAKGMLTGPQRSPGRPDPK